MKRTFLTTAFVTMCAAAVYGQSMKMPEGGADIAVSNAWARATPGTATTGAVYLTITDNGSLDRLTGFSTPVAGMAQLHEMKIVNGVMKMREVAGIPLQTGKPVTLAPGGYHVMLTRLKHRLKEGDTFPLTLIFEHAAPITVQVKVAAVRGSTPMSNMPGMHMPGTKQ